MNEQMIGEYKVLKKIGAGGMARVYLAVHKDIPNLKVVLKILTDPRLVERFRQEADKLALLDGHGNICQIKHFFNHGDDFVIAMEYIDGTTLEEIIKGRGKMEMGESLKIIDDVLATLEFAHQKRICHRDIKPSNIMIDKCGQVKIIDFGIAKAETDPDLTIAGAAVGTPAYMAPEQFTPSDHTNYDQIDVYAVGTTLYYMLTGELPFKGDNQFVLREAKLFSEPTRPRDINREIPRQIEDIIMTAIKRDPDERYASANEMRKAIASLPREEEISSETSFVDKPGREKQREGKSSIWKKVSVAAFILFVIAASYVAFFMPTGDNLPVAPELIGPKDGQTVNTGWPEFSWESTADKDGGYILQYGSDSSFVQVQEVSDLTVSRFITVSDLTVNRYTPDDSLADGRYFWRVRTVDKDGLKSEYSPVSSFSIETAAPVIPKGSLALIIRPSGDIYIDGELYASNRASADISLDTGRHIVVVRNNASIEKVFDEPVIIAAGSKESKRFTFSFPPREQTEPADTSKPKEPQELYGRLSVGSRPANGAMVFINDRLEDHVTPFTFRLRPGEHIVRVMLTLNGEEQSKTDTVIVAADSTSKLIFDFEN